MNLDAKSTAREPFELFFFVRKAANVPRVQCPKRVLNFLPTFTFSAFKDPRVVASSLCNIVCYHFSFNFLVHCHIYQDWMWTSSLHPSACAIMCRATVGLSGGPALTRYCSYQRCGFWTARYAASLSSRGGCVVAGML
jgi:hypothetical protein